jgi:hypothetical protein
MTTVSGSCICGAAGLKVATDIRQIVNCHCNSCRKMNGSAFTTYAIAPHKFLSLTGEENIAEYQFSEGAFKHYCKKCGSPLYNLNSRYPKYAMIYLGCLENSAVLTPTQNIFCESMLGWVEHIADVEKFEKDIAGR